MTDGREAPDAGDAGPSGSATSPLRPPCERLPCNKSSVCSRSYFVVVMVFFHVYIINVIALLFYVHYSSGQDDGNRSGGGGGDAGGGGSHQRPESGRPPSKPESLRDVSLTRIEGIRVSIIYLFIVHFLSLLLLSRHSHQLLWFAPQVGHVQRVSLVPGKVHEMRTLSMKPLLFGKGRGTHVAKK